MTRHNGRRYGLLRQFSSISRRVLATRTFEDSPPVSGLPDLPGATCWIPGQADEGVALRPNQNRLRYFVRRWFGRSSAALRASRAEGRILEAFLLFGQDGFYLGHWVAQHGSPSLHHGSLDGAVETVGRGVAVPDGRTPFIATGETNAPPLE